MKPTYLTKAILAAISFLGELASVMRQNNVPLKKEGRISSSKSSVNQGAQSWECSRNDQARLMLAHAGKQVTPETVGEMELRIADADAKAKAGYAIEKAFPGFRMDAIHNAFLALEKAAQPANVTPLPVAEVVTEAEKRTKARKAS